MSYLAILGRQSRLSLAELETVSGRTKVEPVGQHALLTEEPNLSRLGGTIKIARVVSQSKQLDEKLLLEVVELLPVVTSKLTLGISYYGRRGDVLRLGMQLKKLIRSNGQSIRLVLPKLPGSALSAAQLKYNGLATPEAPEIIILEQSNRVIVALTSQYQDVDAYSARDYDRPERSTRVGMLPPKLAQILINLTGARTGTILDPFCGGGVVLQEARLLGFKVIGSDLALEMVKASRKNMEWLDAQRADLPAWSVTQADARKLKLPAGVKAVVSEGDLGPAFTQSPTAIQISRAAMANTELVRAFLMNLAKQLRTGIPVVLCLPQWQTTNKPILPAVIDEIYRLGYTLTQFAHVDAAELVYHRPGQIVGRRILVMKRT